MEDALALALTSVFSLKQEVLILVVMEDALAHSLKSLFLMFDTKGLNPCCNGRCTRTNHGN